VEPNYHGFFWAIQPQADFRVSKAASSAPGSRERGSLDVRITLRIRCGVRAPAFLAERDLAARRHLNALVRPLLCHGGPFRTSDSMERKFTVSANSSKGAAAIGYRQARIRGDRATHHDADRRLYSRIAASMMIAEGTAPTASGNHASSRLIASWLIPTIGHKRNMKPEMIAATAASFSEKPTSPVATRTNDKLPNNA
jgi:hypothetical protein